MYVFNDKEPEKAFVFLSQKLGQLKKKKISGTLFQQLTPVFVCVSPSVSVVSIVTLLVFPKSFLSCWGSP